MFSTKILFFLTTSTFFLLSMSQEKQIRGSPEVDYPTYYVIPKTSFRCSDQLYNPGFYADTETRCQVFHYCYEHRQESFLCPMGTVFNQPILACDYWYSSNCSLAPSYYRVNAERRNEDHFDEADDSQDSQSGNVFDKMSHLYEVNNEATESPVLKNDSDIPENEFLSKDGVESSGEPLMEKNNETEDYNKYSYDNQFNMVDEEHPEVVKYDLRDSNTLNIHKGSENEQLYETDNGEDFIFSEDGMLHPSQDIYQMYPTDMNFNQEYSGYAEIPSEGNFNYDSNDNFDEESDFQLSDFEFQKRYTDINGNYVRRRPSSRKPVMVIPEPEPEIVELPVVKHRRKPIGITSTVGTDAEAGFTYETNYDSNIYKENDVFVVNEGLESTSSDGFSLDELNSNINDYELRDPKLFYEIQKENDENGPQLHQTDSLNVIYDYSNQKKTRNAYVLSNSDEDEISSNVFGSGGNDFFGVSSVEHESTLLDSNHGDESEVFNGNSEGYTILPDKSSETTPEDASSFDGDSFLGSGSEENMKNLHSIDVPIFPDDQNIFYESEDTEITDAEASYVLPMDLSDTFEGSGISDQETAYVPNFTEEINEPIHFVFKDNPADNVEYGKKSSLSSETFENFLPLENSEDNEGVELVPGGSNGFNYLPHELQEASDNLDTPDETVPEIREIDGSYYVFSDSEYHSNYEYSDSSRIYSEDLDYAVTKNSENISDKTTEELIDNEDNIDDAPPNLDNQDSKHLENIYEKLPEEFEAETSSVIPEHTRQLSTEDLKFLEIMSQNPSPMLQNLFDVSNEKSNFDAKEEMPRFEIKSADQDNNVQTATHKDSAGKEDVHEFQSLASETFSDTKEHLTDVESSENDSEIINFEQIADVSNMDGSGQDVSEIFAFNTSSDTEEHLTDVESSENNSEIFNAEQIVEKVSNADGSGQDKSEIFSPKQNGKPFVSGKEADPFSPLFIESDKILLDGPGSKHKSSLRIPLSQPKNVAVNTVIGKDMKKSERGKRFNENLRTFNPPNNDNPLRVSSEETFREAMFTNIPSAFLKMKHSTWSPYFYNYGLKNSGLNSRTGDLSQSSKLSKLASLGKRLLEAKSSKFNRMKRYIDSYRN